MHLLFIPYGRRNVIEILFNNMEVQKWIMPLHKEGEEDDGQVIGSGIRALPFGVFDYIFPKEQLDKVVTTLRQREQVSSRKEEMVGLGPFIKEGLLKWFLRRAFNFRPIPKDIDDSVTLPWTMTHIRTFIIGYREDGEVVEPYGPRAGWSHEAI